MLPGGKIALFKESTIRILWFGDEEGVPDPRKLLMFINFDRFFQNILTNIVLVLF